MHFNHYLYEKETSMHINNFLKSVIPVLLTISLIISGYQLNGQSNLTNPGPKFKIEIQNTKNGISLGGIDGCAWTTLAFNIEVGQSQNIDNFGMVGKNDPTAVNTFSHSDFLFSITKTKDGISLDGIKGTSWVHLSFTLPVGKKTVFDESGTKAK